MTHECIVRVDPDPFSSKTQYFVQCRCHMDGYKTWRPGDAVIVCPVSGDDLTAGIERGKEVGGGRAA